MTLFHLNPVAEAHLSFPKVQLGDSYFRTFSPTFPVPLLGPSVHCNKETQIPFASYILESCIQLPKIEVAMVNLQTVQAHNAALKSLAPGLVAVFGKFNLLQHSTLYDAPTDNRLVLEANCPLHRLFSTLSTLLKTIHPTNTLQSAAPPASRSPRPSPSPVTPPSPKSTSSAAVSPPPTPPSPP